MKVSVIVPCYNVEKWLPACLDSILNQTYSTLEIIAIDDGSTDQTGAIIDDYAARDCRIVPVHQKNGGLVAAREVGIQLATGDYVGFVDGDDTIEPDMYERLLKNVLQYNADISHCGVAFLWEDGRKELHYGTGNVQVYDNTEGQRALLEGTQIEPALCNKLYRAELLKDSCLDPSVLNNEDLLRNFVLFQRAQKSVYEDFCGYRYFQRNGSMSKDRTKTIQIFRHIAKARKLILDHCSPEIFPYGMRLWLSTYITFFNLNASNMDSEVQSLCQECRGVLIQERKNLRYLIPRQRLAAGLIVLAPRLQQFVFKIYDSRRRVRG